MPIDILDLIQEAAVLQDATKKVREETEGHKTNLWLGMAVNNMEQTLAYLLYAQKQLEEGENTNIKVRHYCEECEETDD